MGIIEWFLFVSAYRLIHELSGNNCLCCKSEQSIRSILAFTAILILLGNQLHRDYRKLPNVPKELPPRGVYIRYFNNYFLKCWLANDMKNNINK